MEIIENAKITGTKLGREDHGIMTAWIFVEGAGWGCGFGGYALDEYDKEKKERVCTASGFEAINQILKTLEIDNWEDLKGQFIRVETNGKLCGGKLINIGHLMKDKWFSFEEFFKQ